MLSIDLMFSAINCPSRKPVWAELLKPWLALTSIKYHDNLLILMLLNQWLALIMLRTTGPWLLLIGFGITDFIRFAIAFAAILLSQLRRVSGR